MSTLFYKIYLCDGNTLELAEPLGIPVYRTFAGRYEKAEENDVLRAAETSGTILYVPKKNILYLRTMAGVEKQGGLNI